MTIAYRTLSKLVVPALGNLFCVARVNLSTIKMASNNPDYKSATSLRILAFPCNQFAGQEPGNSEDIVCFMNERKVNFDMFEKIDVNGDSAHPLWKFLKHKQGGTLGNFIKWNFTKFIVDKNGVPVERHGPNTDPINLVKSLENYW
ncbi:glutathione peroxidase [Danaus plexippus plexippus]|uniref:Glutathione peroxidase n=1 Tax=Danaus plexippus plexippus TaxID=278856 RepID=A0A212FB10_DANPL|nr:glutathione peroxidase [Danaus plexippus plexippus]